MGGGIGMCASGGCSHLSIVDGGVAFLLELMIVMGVPGYSRRQSLMSACIASFREMLLRSRDVRSLLRRGSSAQYAHDQKKLSIFVMTMAKVSVAISRGASTTAAGAILSFALSCAMPCSIR